MRYDVIHGQVFGGSASLTRSHPRTNGPALNCPAVSVATLRHRLSMNGAAALIDRRLGATRFSAGDHIDSSRLETLGDREYPSLPESTFNLSKTRATGVAPALPNRDHRAIPHGRPPPTHCFRGRMAGGSVLHARHPAPSRLQPSRLRPCPSAASCSGAQRSPMQASKIPPSGGATRKQLRRAWPSCTRYVGGRVHDRRQRMTSLRAKSRCTASGVRVDHPVGERKARRPAHAEGRRGAAYRRLTGFLASMTLNQRSVQASQMRTGTFYRSARDGHSAPRPPGPSRGMHAGWRPRTAWSRRLGRSAGSRARWSVGGRLASAGIVGAACCKVPRKVAHL